MNGAIQFHSKVGSDGILTLNLPLGLDQAESEVLVTIAPLTPQAPSPPGDDWHAFLRETYGSCAGLGLERPEQR
jgi:hypothetical protein